MKKCKPRRWNLTLSLMLFVFGVIMMALLAAGIIILILYRGDLITALEEQGPLFISKIPFVRILLQLMLFSGVLALALTRFFSKLALNPIRKVIEATRKVAAGDFSVQVQLKGVQELEELSQSFNKMTQELASIETMRSDFVNVISHEYKTPIAAIEGFAEVLQNGNLSAEEQQECLGFIISESKRLAALSINVLALSKYENTEIVGEQTVFSLDEQIRRVIALTEPKWSGKGIDIHVDMENDVAFEGNEDLTQQIWLNLLVNAIKFSPRGSIIDIRLRRQGDAIYFTIEDEGVGMDEQAQAHCFDKFYQEDESQSGPGNGLGLAIVKRIVELHGGTVEVQSEPEQGSRFTVTL